MPEVQPGSFSVTGWLFAGMLRALCESLAQACACMQSPDRSLQQLTASALQVQGSLRPQLASGHERKACFNCLQQLAMQVLGRGLAAATSQCLMRALRPLLLSFLLLTL